MPLFMYVGKMRQGKSYCAVKKIDELTKENNKNLLANREIFASHLKYFEDRGMADQVEQFMQLLDCEQFPEYHEQLKVPFDEFLKKYNEENGTKLDLLKPVRQIYSDIEGTIELGKIPNLLKSPDDWRTTPKGSIIFYDEFQIFRSAFKFDGNRLSKDQMIIDISRIGHVDKDLYLITQDAENLNFSLRKLIDKMYFVKRPPQNIQACSVYTFDCFLKNPKAAAESQRKPHKYVSWEVVKYNNYIYSLYKSASSHDSIKRKIPLMFYIKILGVLLVLSVVLYGIFASPVLSFFATAIKTMMHTNVGSVADMTNEKTLAPQQPKDHKTTDSSSFVPSVNGVPQPITDLDKDCRKAENLERPECKRWFENYSSKQQNSSDNTPVKYDPNKPFDDEQVMKNVTYQVTNKPVFSGCMKLNGKYVAYSQQGTILKGVSQEDCRKVIENGERPFDYFGDRKSQNTNTAFNSALGSKDNTNTASVPPDLEKAKVMYENQQGI